MLVVLPIIFTITPLSLFKPDSEVRTESSTVNYPALTRRDYASAVTKSYVKQATVFKVL